MRSLLKLGSLLVCMSWCTFATPLAVELCQDKQAQEPPPMRRHRGAWALSSRSTLVFTSAPDRPHGLDIDLAYPQRGRWMLHAPDPGEDRRTLLYLYGSQLWSIPYGKAGSSPAKETRAVEMRLMFSLRRGLLAWPHQFDWTGEDDERTALLGKHGSLRAVLGKDGLPTLLEALRADGNPYETLRNIRWKKVSGQMQPSSFDMVVKDKKIWHETILRVDRTLRFLDSYFLPQDRRPKAPSRGDHKSRRFAFPTGFEWELALDQDQMTPKTLERLRIQAAREVESSGAQLLPGIGRVIDEGGRGVAVLLQVRSFPGDPPDNWRRTPAAHGIVRRLKNAAALNPALVSSLVREAREVGTPARIVAWTGAKGLVEVRVEVLKARSPRAFRPLKGTAQVSPR